MAFRSSNKSWSKTAQELYFNKFLPDYRSGRFVVTDGTFSNLEILNCLESETNSSHSLAKLLEKLLSNKKIDSLVVIGAGSGRLGTQIIKLFPQVDLYEVDKNSDVIKRLKNKNRKNTHRMPILGEACKLPLKNESVDVVLCYSVFRYIKNVQECLDEFTRVVRNGGKIIISEAKDTSTIERIKTHLKNQQIVFKTRIIPTIKLPHLTFFYYLVNQFDHDKTITQIISEEMSNSKISMEQAAFIFASYSLGSIYTIIWERNV